MNQIIYLIVYPFLWILSKLPWRLFYIFSDVVCFVVYKLIGYRKKVVSSNLKAAFSDKNTQELLAIEKKHYQHLCDLFLEMIRSMGISKQDLQQRFHIKNPEILQELENDSKSLLLLTAHYGNYEWSNSLELQTSMRCVGVYKKIKNPFFDRMVRKVRQRFGSDVIENVHITKYALTCEKQVPKIQRLYGLIIDQSPKLNKRNHYEYFLGREVPVFVGAEVLARKLDLNVAYLETTKVKRGFYESEIKIITKDAPNEQMYAITKKYFKIVEQQIHKAPEYYLWTHKRWKHAK